MALLRRCAFRLLFVFFALLANPLYAQTSFKTVVVFGDSLSDTGNIANLTQSQYHIPFPSDNQLLGIDYTYGRFTDGTDTQPAASTAYVGVWVEQLAAGFGVTIKDSLDGGTDYAYGDASTGTGTTTESKSFLGATLSITLNNMGQQVSDYLATNPKPDANTLYVLWGGSNDLLDAATAGQDPIAAAGVAVQNEIALVQQLVAAGGTNFMLPNLPPLGSVPESAGTPLATALNNASIAFAQGLAQGLAGVKAAAALKGITLNIYQPDILSLFASVAGSPMSVGLGNVTSAAQGISGSPDTYLIWDGLHPTTTGHHLAAASAANLIKALGASTTSLSVPAAVIAGQAIPLAATVSSSASAAKPTGLVTFFNGTTAVASAALDATGTASTTYSGGSASVSSYAITAVYAGDTTYGVSASSAQVIPVLTSAVGTTTTLTSSNTNANLGAQVTFTATVSPSVSTYGTPSGTVTFLDGSAKLGTGTLSAGVATYATSSLTAGTHSITASYAAAGVFGGSTSSAVSEVIVAPSFTAQANPASLSIASGGSGTTVLSATPAGGYTGTITLACGTLPAHFLCSFSTTTLSITSSTSTAPTSTLTIGTNAQAALDLPLRPGSWTAPRVFSATLLFPGLSSLFLLALRRKRTSLQAIRLAALVALLSAGAVLGLGGCGSNNNAPKGTYTVPVTFTPSTGSGQTVNVSVTVQ